VGLVELLLVVQNLLLFPSPKLGCLDKSLAEKAYVWVRDLKILSEVFFFFERCTVQALLPMRLGVRMFILHTSLKIVAGSA